MNKPLIGLTPSHDTQTDDISMRPTYVNAIKAAGGIPVVLPLDADQQDLRQLVRTLDGFLFTGGPDPHPFLFGEETHACCGNVSVKRDSLELALLPLVMKVQKPVLGICRGIQIINVGLGGTIYQDIPSQFQPNTDRADSSSFLPIAHRQPFHYTVPSHTVALVPDTRMAHICQRPIIQVNSMHHQAVKDLAPGCIIAGTAPGGLIEAMEMPSYPFLIGVQWHPEYLWEQDPAAANLFRQFIQACCTKMDSFCNEPRR